MALRHPKYYMQDGDVIFLVGNRLFRIHKRLLEASAFVGMFDRQRPSETKGKTDETPIVLIDASVGDFEGLMRILYPCLLENPLLIPVYTLTQAMRIANKYRMQEVQTAIMRVINSKSLGSGISEAIAMLCFITEFPEHFEKNYVQKVFVQACSTSYYPSTEDLRRLMTNPDLMVVMMKYREGNLNPDGAVWNPEPESPPSGFALGSGFNKIKLIAPMDAWLLRELKSLGLTKG